MKINNICYLFFTIFLLPAKKNKAPPNPSPGRRRRLDNIPTCKIYVPEIPVADKSFSGSIGDLEIRLGRFPGDTLTFIIPDVGEGPAELKVTMGRQVRTWDLQLSKWPNLTDQRISFKIFIAIISYTDL